MTWAKVKPESGSMVFTSSYNRSLIVDLKASIPGSDRRPIYKHGKFSHWLIDVKHITLLSKIVKRNLGVNLDGIPGIVSQGVKQAAKQTSETKLFKVLYIGAPKDRGNGNSLAYGLVGSDWNIAFPESVLKDFFECGLGDKKEHVPTSITTFYGLLTVSHDASGSDIKRAYRVMAKRWHPDVNRDEDAGEMFRKIQKAYETLGNPLQRRRYDAGLILQASVGKREQKWEQVYGPIYRPPIRCGLFLCVGQWRIGRFHVKQIVQREEITNSQGKMMTSFWDKTLQEVVTSFV